MILDKDRASNQGNHQTDTANLDVQKLNLVRVLARQSDQNPASTPKQNLSLSRGILDALVPAAQTGELSALSALQALEQVQQRVSDHLNGLEARLKRLESRRNQRRN